MTKRLCRVCGQPYDPKKRPELTPARLNQKSRITTVTRSYHCPSCGQFDEGRLRREVIILIGHGLDYDAIAKRIGIEKGVLLRHLTA